MRLIVAVLLGLTLVIVARCDWLPGFDPNPPICRITSPADFSSVNGLVAISATATDSVGVERVEFYADGSLVGTDSTVPYSASWDASGFAAGSPHWLSCAAYDPAQNKGYSDTIEVVIGVIGQQSVFHGELEVTGGTARSVSFDAGAGDTLVGDVQVVSGGALAKFAWLDSANYRKFTSSQPYTALFEASNLMQASVSQPVPAAGRHYLVFANGSSATVTCWARFVLE